MRQPVFQRFTSHRQTQQHPIRPVPPQDTLHQPFLFAFTPEPEPFNFAVLPRTANQDIYQLPRVAPAELEGGNGSITVERWSPQRRAVRVELNGNDRLLLRAFAFPGWQVSVDGESAAIESSRALRVRS